MPSPEVFPQNWGRGVDNNIAMTYNIGEGAGEKQGVGGEGGGDNDRGEWPHHLLSQPAPAKGSTSFMRMIIFRCTLQKAFSIFRSMIFKKVKVQ